MSPGSPSRRELLSAVAALGLGPATFHRAMAQQASKASTVTPEMVEAAEWIAGITLTPEQRKLVALGLTRTTPGNEELRKTVVGNEVPPALQFNPAPGAAPTCEGRGSVQRLPPAVEVRKPANEDEIAFLPVTSLAELIRTKQITSVELTKLYLKRLRAYDPLLKFVVTFTDDLAMKQAEAADREIAAGKSRGPLHGIPWGAKDLIAVPGYKTTWGAATFRDQVRPETATVAERLENAGAVLIAKLTLGALAWGDQWFGGMTRNPWNPDRGSSGSSAGSASAVAAGCVGFAIGTETLGSIVSPSTECGVTGLRPTFGRVSRHGCMALAWSMDKIGPIARSVEDTALIFGAIHGADGLDPSAVDRRFDWPCKTPHHALRVGYTGDAEGRKELQVLKDLGVKLVPIELPTEYPLPAMQQILFTEAASAFDDLVSQGDLDGIGLLWPAAMQRAMFTPAVQYLRAQRVRTLLMRAMAKVMEKVDLYVGGNDLVITNFTGHPTICLPNGFIVEKGEPARPASLTFTGRLYGESGLMSVAKAYQDITGHHRRTPPLKSP